MVDDSGFDPRQEQEIFRLLRNVLIGSGANSASYSLRTGSEAACVEVKNEWSCTFTVLSDLIDGI